MENLNFVLGLKEMEKIVYIIKTLFMSLCTYCIFLKLTNQKIKFERDTILVLLINSAIAIMVGFIKERSNSLISIICSIMLQSILYEKICRLSIGYSILITTISLGINYILYFCTLLISYILNIILNIQNKNISLIIILFIHAIIVYLLFKIRRLKNGVKFLHKNFREEHLNILVFNVAIVIVFSSIIFTSYDTSLTSSMFFVFIIFAVFMFITIQQSLQLYYKQKLLIQDLEETKKELENKKKEIEQLEKENLNFSKISHSIAHKQKSLEYKLNELMLKNEIATEIDIKDRINAISKELETKTIVELNKTGIPEIDDMLKYMQAECTKNKIEFELQLSGNIHHMVNNYIEKESLEILLADHIKNAIIAINHSDNSNKNILVRLGIIDGIYSLYVYDSGIEFEIDTLHKLGKVPITTHRDIGGTGIGFMNTFDTLKKYKASMIINEYGKPCKNNYTKVIMIKFDKKNELKIESYRSGEIEKINKQKIE